MPELPEVETTRRGIAPFVVGRRLRGAELRRRDLRWPVPAALDELLAGRRCLALERRAKYLLLRFTHGHLIGHLGMSGSLRVCTATDAWRKHDHLALLLPAKRELRYHDPRRFGAWLWTEEPPEEHPLIRHLGPEPLGEAFTPEAFFASTRGRRRSIKEQLMDPQVVVGVGNIYASEALFLAGIRPGRAARSLRQAESARLVPAVRQVLADAIERGGTTLRDFLGADGTPGYFAQELWVYGRDGEACRRCGSQVKSRILGQRNSFYCPSCQA